MRNNEKITINDDIFEDRALRNVDSRTVLSNDNDITFERDIFAKKNIT